MDYAKFLTASLLYFAYHQRDGVGLVTFDRDVTAQVRAGRRKGQLHNLLLTVDRARAAKETEFSKPLDFMAEFLKRRGIVVLVSDLYDEVDNIVKGVSHLRAKGNEVIVFHVLDDFELNFPFDTMTEFEDLETMKKLNVIPQYLRKEYLDLIHGHIAALRERLTAIGVDYTVMNTNQSLDAALFAYLLRRSKQKG
jgi:uncharacterized protein (DUF58 family)